MAQIGISHWIIRISFMVYPNPIIRIRLYYTQSSNPNLICSRSYNISSKLR
ncbi:unnamed protein product [Arabidopsis halleri]